MKNWIIIILLFGIVASFYFMSLNHVTDTGNMVQLEKEKDSLKVLFDSIQTRYEVKQKQLPDLEAELLKSQAVVKLSEQKLSELLKRERHAQIENKKLIEKYSNYQLDSAFRAMYPRPDSVRN